MSCNNREGYILFACVDLTLADGSGRSRGATYEFKDGVSVCMPPRDSESLRVVGSSSEIVSVVVRGPDGEALGGLSLQNPDSCTKSQTFDGWFTLDSCAPVDLVWDATDWKSSAELAGHKVRVLARTVCAADANENSVNSALELQNFLIEALRAHGQRRIPLAEIHCNRSALLLPKFQSPKEQDLAEGNEARCVSTSENIEKGLQICGFDFGKSRRKQVGVIDSDKLDSENKEPDIWRNDSDLSSTKGSRAAEVKLVTCQMKNQHSPSVIEKACDCQGKSTTMPRPSEEEPSDVLGELSAYLPQENNRVSTDTGSADNDLLQGLTVFRSVRMQVCGQRSNPASPDVSTFDEPTKSQPSSAVALPRSYHLNETTISDAVNTSFLHESIIGKQRQQNLIQKPCSSETLEASASRATGSDASNKEKGSEGMNKASQTALDASNKTGDSLKLIDTLRQMKLDLVDDRRNYLSTQCWSSRSSASSAKAQPEDEPQVVCTGKSHNVPCGSNTVSSSARLDGVSKMLSLTTSHVMPSLNSNCSSSVGDTHGQDAFATRSVGDRPLQSSSDNLRFPTTTHAGSTASLDNFLGSGNVQLPQQHVGKSHGGNPSHVGKPGIAWMPPDSTPQNFISAHDPSFACEELSRVEFVDEDLPSAMTLPRLPDHQGAAVASRVPVRKADPSAMIERTRQCYHEDLRRMQTAQDVLRQEIAEAQRHCKEVKAGADAEEILLNRTLEKLEANNSTCKAQRSQNLVLDSGGDYSQAHAMAAEQKRRDLHAKLLSLCAKVQWQSPQECGSDWMSGRVKSQFKEARSQCQEAMGMWKTERQALAAVESEVRSEEAAAALAIALHEEVTHLQSTLHTQRSLVNTLTEQIASLEASLSEALAAAEDASGSEIRYRSEIRELRSQIEEHSSALELEQGRTADWKRRALEYKAQVAEVPMDFRTHQLDCDTKCRSLVSSSKVLEENRESVLQQCSILQREVEEMRGTLHHTQAQMCSEAQRAQHEARLARNHHDELQSMLLQRRLQMEALRQQTPEVEEVTTANTQKSAGGSLPLHFESQIPAPRRRARSLSSGTASKQRREGSRIVGVIRP